MRGRGVNSTAWTGTRCSSICGCEPTCRPRMPRRFASSCGHRTEGEERIRMRQHRRSLVRAAVVGMVLLGRVPRVHATGDAAAGKELYTAFCTLCHGERGNGAGPDG